MITKFNNPNFTFNCHYTNSRYLIEQTDEIINEKNLKLMQLPGYIVLTKEPGSNHYRGIIELSFSLDTSKDRTQFFWSSDNASSNFGGKFKIDGYKDAEYSIENWSKSKPDWIFEIFDARDDSKLPVYLDWDRWLNGNRRADTLSGVNDKFDARNLIFQMKE